MSRITLSLLTSTVLLSGVAIVGNTVMELIAPAKLLAQQIVYPSTSDPNGVMVTGQGIARTPADVAEIRFLVSGTDPEAADAEMRQVENNSSKPSSGKTKPQLQVTEASLKPIVARSRQRECLPVPFRFLWMQTDLTVPMADPLETTLPARFGLR